MISHNARMLQDEVAGLRNLPKIDESILGKATPCCQRKGGKYVGAFYGERTRSQVVFCSCCGHKYYRIVDRDVISPFDGNDYMKRHAYV